MHYIEMHFKQTCKNCRNAKIQTVMTCFPLRKIRNYKLECKTSKTIKNDLFTYYNCLRKLYVKWVNIFFNQHQKIELDSSNHEYDM